MTPTLSYRPPVKAEHLQRCQVETPPDIVSLVWSLALKLNRQQQFGDVLDLGAGDARFANAPGAFNRYVGIETDRSRMALAKLPVNARVINADAMTWPDSDYDLCIGNPPYIRHHHLDPKWRKTVIERFQTETGVSLKRTANLFVLFLMQALLRTKEKGLIVQLVPFEWVTRPSASELRDYIRRQGWGVQVYRFNSDIFPRVLTTASITVVDKRKTNGRWVFGEIGRSGRIQTIDRPSGTSKAVLPYAKRDEQLHALRGLSPGGQEIFVLTEEERLHYSLRKRRDVVPCVTSLRRVSIEETILDSQRFERDYVQAGARCWLIRSDREKRSSELSHYLETIGDRWKQYSTCTNRDDWARYTPHPTPKLLISSGFVGKSPKVLVNKVGAIAVGSVYGILSSLDPTRAEKLADKLRAYDFEKRVVHHSNNLKKLEVRQLNAVLNRIFI